MTNFIFHPNPTMGMYLENDDVLGVREWAFSLSDDERSQAYLAWVAEGNTAEEWNPNGN